MNTVVRIFGFVVIYLLSACEKETLGGLEVHITGVDFAEVSLLKVNPESNDTTVVRKEYWDANHADRVFWGTLLFGNYIVRVVTETYLSETLTEVFGNKVIDVGISRLI